MHKVRRCNKRWLDADCPAGVLAIIDSKTFIDRYTILFTETFEYEGKTYVTYLGTNESGSVSGHGLMPAHEAAAYRYRNKHRYMRWSDLPESVKAMVHYELSLSEV
jgi:hypothetical protein